MSTEKHRLLARQMKIYGIDLEKNPELAPFIDAVTSSYNQYEKEQKILNNSSSKLINKIRLTNTSLKTTIESIDSFNYHVSHDLKSTIISSISLASMASKYFKKDNKKKLGDILNRLEINTKSGLDVIEKYLQISKLEALESKSKDEKINIEEISKEVLEKIDLTNKLKVVFLKKDFEHLIINEVSLYSIIQNFMTNAYKYSSPGSKPVLEISLEKVDELKVLRFKDNGLGIDMQKNGDKIFQPFVRLKNKDIEGTGIGLFIVKKIINRLGGSISVESTLGEGTTFSVKLPQ